MLPFVLLLLLLGKFEVARVLLLLRLLLLLLLQLVLSLLLRVVRMVLLLHL